MAGVSTTIPSPAEVVEEDETSLWHCSTLKNMNTFQCVHINILPWEMVQLNIFARESQSFLGAKSLVIG